MNLIRESYDEQHVRAVVAFGKTADHKLYEDSAFTSELGEEIAADLFKKGLLLIDDGTNMLKPISMTENAFLTVILSGDVPALTSVTWTAKAAE